ncbi:hypothetical protein MTO96_019150 [Rhipicephalus appendiculatus]
MSRWTRPAKPPRLARPQDGEGWPKKKSILRKNAKKEKANEQSVRRSERLPFIADEQKSDSSTAIIEWPFLCLVPGADGRRTAAAAVANNAPKGARATTTRLPYGACELRCTQLEHRIHSLGGEEETVL